MHWDDFDVSGTRVCATALFSELLAEVSTTGTEASNSLHPVDDGTTIAYSLPVTAKVRLTVHNLLGCRKTALVDQELVAGSHSSWLDASSWPNGIYVYRLFAEEQVATGRLVHWH